MESSTHVNGDNGVTQKQTVFVLEEDKYWVIRVFVRNNLSQITADVFHNLTRLEALTYSGNDLKELPEKIFRDNRFLQKLDLHGNQFITVPEKAFRDLTYLLELNLDDNRIESVPEGAFQGLHNLQGLWLAKNNLTEVPRDAFSELTGLMSLRLTKNRIKRIRRHDFINHPKLLDISLAINEIEAIDDGAFSGLGKLKFLDLHMNRLHVMPGALSQLTALVQLNLQFNQLSDIPDGSFVSKQLQFLELENNPIKSIGNSAFANLPSLQRLVLSEAYDIIRFPNLTGTTNLTLLRLDRAKIKAIPRNMCQQMTKLRHLDLHSNKLRTLPPLTGCRSMKVLNLANNELTSINGQLFKGLTMLQDLTIGDNYIETIMEDDTFEGLPNLEYLNLANNQINKIHPDAFKPLTNLKNLNLANNNLKHLPTAGLANLEKLKIFHNLGLREFPPKEEFPSIKNFYLTYAYHCCDYINIPTEQKRNSFIPHESIVWLMEDDSSKGREYNDSDITPDNENMTLDKDHPPGQDFPFFHQHQELPKLSGGGDPDDPLLEGNMGDTYLDMSPGNIYPYTFERMEVSITCVPKPGPFMPCDDLFGFWTLRCGVWVVFMLALLGNGVVFFVSVTSKSKMDVTRFLICNLAAADFFMGVYLGMLAIIDASTLGQFKKYAIRWQLSAGCSIAGFLGVLSSELSVFTLTVITLERFYAITHAIQLNKRLSLKHASMIMLGGWIWSLSLAILPIFGISDYRKFAVCLPFKIEDIISKTYVCFIMAFNGVSFFVILSCYVIMYISIRHSGAWNSNDTRVAKRMALLVITDLACWAPIAFLSLCAAFGINLVNLTEAKVLTIFVLPLNSCANPFLYAIFTKQFKKDCVLLCRRLEDSSIARHFSQVSPGHISMSWKCHRRPSGLRILMGEGKSGTSNNSASHSYGLVNNNSEISTGTNKELKCGDHAHKEDKYLHLPLPAAHRYQHYHHHHGNGKHHGILSAMSGGGGVNGPSTNTHNSSIGSYTHKYKPCPTGVGQDELDLGDCGAEDWSVEVLPQDGTVCNHGRGGGGCLYRAVRYKPVKNTCRGVKDAQVILHQGYCFQSGTETGGTTMETYLSNDDYGDDVIRGICKGGDTRPSSGSCEPAKQACTAGVARTHSLTLHNGCGRNSLTRQRQYGPGQHGHQKQYPNVFEEAQRDDADQRHHQGQQPQPQQRKTIRPPSITLDSGEAGESIEMIFCPSGEFCELPLPLSRNGNNPESKGEGDEKDDGSSCVWVKRASPLPKRWSGSASNQRRVAGSDSKGRGADKGRSVSNDPLRVQPTKLSGQQFDVCKDGSTCPAPGEYFKRGSNSSPCTGRDELGVASNKGSDILTPVSRQIERENGSVPTTAADLSNVRDKGGVYDAGFKTAQQNETKGCMLSENQTDHENSPAESIKQPQMQQQQQKGTSTSISPACVHLKDDSPKHGGEEAPRAPETARSNDINTKPDEDVANRRHRRDHGRHSKSKTEKSSKHSRSHHRHNNTHGKRSKPKPPSIDKSVHLRFFQESLAEARGDSRHVIYRSNSLVELTEPQLQKALSGEEDQQTIHARGEINLALSKEGEEGEGRFYGRNARNSRLRRSLTSKQEERLSSRRGMGEEGEDDVYNNWKNFMQHRNTEAQHRDIYDEEDEFSKIRNRDTMGSTDLDNDDAYSNSNASVEGDLPCSRRKRYGNYKIPEAEPFIAQSNIRCSSGGNVTAHFASNGKPASRDGRVSNKQRALHADYGDEDDDEESPSSATNGILAWEDNGLTGMNDSDDLRDSLSSARNSADKESGFHSQV